MRIRIIMDTKRDTRCTGTLPTSAERLAAAGPSVVYDTLRVAKMVGVES